MKGLSKPRKVVKRAVDLYVCLCLCVVCGYLKSVLVGDQSKHFSVIAEVLSCDVTKVVPMEQSRVHFYFILLTDYYYYLRLREIRPLPSP